MFEDKKAGALVSCYMEKENISTEGMVVGVFVDSIFVMVGNKIFNFWRRGLDAGKEVSTAIKVWLITKSVV